MSPSRRRSVGAGSEPFTVRARRGAPVRFTGVSPIVRSKEVPLSSGGHGVSSGRPLGPGSDAASARPTANMPAPARPVTNCRRVGRKSEGTGTVPRNAVRVGAGESGGGRDESIGESPAGGGAPRAGPPASRGRSRGGARPRAAASRGRSAARSAGRRGSRVSGRAARSGRAAAGRLPRRRRRSAPGAAPPPEPDREGSDSRRRGDSRAFPTRRRARRFGRRAATRPDARNSRRERSPPRLPALPAARPERPRGGVPIRMAKARRSPPPRPSRPRRTATNRAPPRPGRKPGRPRGRRRRRSIRSRVQPSAAGSGIDHISAIRARSGQKPSCSTAWLR